MLDGLQPVLSAAAMRRADARTIQEFGISAQTLMESAGKGAAEQLLREKGPIDTVVVYGGKGHNGGDGFVLARYLHDAGARVHVVHLGKPGAMSNEADARFGTLQALADADPEGRLSLVPFEAGMEPPSADVHVDAILGTGLSSALREPLLTLIQRLNHVPGTKIALDVPTGLHADLGLPLGAAFRADVTYAMAALKTGHCLHEGPTYTGRCTVIDIGIPRVVLHDAAHQDPSGSAYKPSDPLVASWMPTRGSNAHKYSVGLALVVAGSPGMSGAACMASTAAARVGAGYVTCACDHRIQDTLEAKMTEITTMPLPASHDGIETPGGLETLFERLAKARSVVVGCGLGRGRSTQAFVLELLERIDGPVVVDADALFALAGRMDIVRRRAGGRWILTPHEGEFRRLLEKASGETGPDLRNRIAAARCFADAWNCVLVLKGLPAAVAAPGGHTWMNATGNPALASAGTGDVLAGLCGGLLAQGLPAEQAAVAALHLGGAAADRYAASHAGRSMQANDLLGELPQVMKERLNL